MQSNMTVNTNTTEAVDLGGRVLSGVHVPEGFNGANLTVQTALTIDGGYYDIHKAADGAAYLVTVGTPPCYVPFDTAQTKGIRFLKLLSNTNANANFSLVLSVREGD